MTYARIHTHTHTNHIRYESNCERTSKRERERKQEPKTKSFSNFQFNIHQRLHWQLYKTVRVNHSNRMECRDFSLLRLAVCISVNKLTSLLTCTSDVNVTSVYFARLPLFHFFLSSLNAQLCSFSRSPSHSWSVSPSQTHAHASNCRFILMLRRIKGFPYSKDFQQQQQLKLYW